MAAKRTTKRGSPWANLAREIQLINPKMPPKEVDSQAWGIWFAAACPLTSKALEEQPDCMSELYEQSSGRFVSDEGEKEDDNVKE